ncbi:uncharacterized GPI-anchored protein At3g06035-like isoform X1 [Punica granatum]|uniref:Uncharacterized GPI-anchored protein At3g06035-like isoform X1 n=1 Tax=Punica granatum TaxID=22663 RepID=A0A6P8DV05_PUNGR|nr:uncharacterized GPI-anchored protein At3g06035-like isoform X1 [Punica granatum]
MMSDLKLLLSLSFLVATTFALVRSNEKEEEDDLLQGINSYRKSLNLLPLAQNDRAGCLADEIAERLQNHPCSTSTYGINLVPGTGPQSTDYLQLLSKCDIGVNHMGDGVILPVCVQDLVPSLVLANYTQSQYARYLNDLNYTGAGFGSDGDWMVVVLSTDSLGGSFAKGAGDREPVHGWIMAMWSVVLLMAL